MLIDTHCHLEWESYQEDFDEMLFRAKSAGVGRIVSIGTDEASNQATRVLVTKYDQIYRCVGYHPDCVLEEGFDEEKINSLIAMLERELEYPKTVGVGECGLDYYVIERAEGLTSSRKDVLRDLQRELFERQILLAIQYDLPLSLHVRDDREDAYADVIEILNEYFGSDSDYFSREFSFSLKELNSGYSSGNSGATDFERRQDDRKIAGVLHCVSGSAGYVDAARELGFMVSFAGNVSYKNAMVLQDHATRVPLSDIVVETDGPFLSPVPYRGKRNEPGYVVETAKRIAELRGISFEDLCDSTTENATRLFRF